MGESSALIQELRAHNRRVNNLLSESERLIERAEHCEQTQQPNLANLYWQRAEVLLAGAQVLMSDGKVAA